jgi:hypothetical protein
MAGASTSGLLLGIFTFLLGLGAILAALRRRRRRASYPETYAASGGIVYTGVQMGCGAVLLVSGVGLVVLAVIFRQ